MTNVIEIKATARETTGKSSHKLAPEGLVPAVVYGPKIDSRSLAVGRRDFDHLMHEASVGSTLIALSIEGEARPLQVIIKEVKRDEVKGLVQHIDFWAVDMAHTLQTTVAIDFVGSAEGERAGGVLMHLLRELKIEANPKDLPEHIEVDVSALQIGDSITVADITPPAGVTFLDDPEAALASVTGPMAEEEVAEIEEVTEVPEVGKESAEAEE